MFASAKGKQQKWVRQLQPSGTVYRLYPILPFGIVACTFFPTTFLEIAVYTLGDLGDLSNLIGSLSRTIQQYSPPSEWIMCELGVFPIYLENDLLKVDKILGLTFFKTRKDLEGFNTTFFNLL